MPLLRNIGTLARCLPDGGQREVHVIEQAALSWEAGRVSWVGPEAELTGSRRQGTVFDCGGRLVVPGLVDCHTHLAFAGWRAAEFVQRIEGRSYEEIARAGGGILRTVAATRRAGTDELRSHCLRFLREAAAQGVTTVECKSGYGLDRETELRVLELYRKLGDESGPRIVPTFLGAHKVPPEFEGRRESYVDLLVGEMIPEVASQGLASFCDVFHEEIAFNTRESRTILKSAQASGLGARMHADQLADNGGAALAASLGAVSADHLECISDGGVEALAGSGTVAVSLPLATLYLGQTPMPARRLILAGVPVAVATDFNPGSAPSNHLPLAMLLACTLQKMTPAEVLKGATAIAARAVGLEDSKGSLEVGRDADFAVIDAPDVETWLSQFRANACVATVREGEVIAGELGPQ